MQIEIYKNLNAVDITQINTNKNQFLKYQTKSILYNNLKNKDRKNLYHNLLKNIKKIKNKIYKYKFVNIGFYCVLTSSIICTLSAFSHFFGIIDNKAIDIINFTDCFNHIGLLLVIIGILQNAIKLTQKFINTTRIYIYYDYARPYRSF